MGTSEVLAFISWCPQLPWDRASTQHLADEEVVEPEGEAAEDAQGGIGSLARGVEALGSPGQQSMQDRAQHWGQVGGTVGGQVEQVIPQPQEIFLPIGLPGVCREVLHQLLLLSVPLLCCAFDTCRSNITGQQVGWGLDLKEINL